MTLANRITLARIALTPFFLVAWYVVFPGHDWVALALFVIVSLTDLVDGRIARSRGEVTDFGRFMDPIADKVLTTVAFLVLVEAGTLPAWAAMIFIVRDIMVSGLRMTAAKGGVVIAAAWLGKAKTVSQIVCCGVLLVVGGPFQTWGIPLCEASLAVALLFTLWSGGDYLWAHRRFLTGGQTEPEADNGEGKGAS